VKGSHADAMLESRRPVQQIDPAVCAAVVGPFMPSRLAMAAYTDSPSPLQHDFVVNAGRSDLRGQGDAPLVPGLGADLMSPPYFVLRRR
jgi:hypothetical protein